MAEGGGKREDEEAEFRISWSRVCPSARRQKAIYGAMVGIAVGEALGLARQGFSRRLGLWLFGRGPLRYQAAPRIGVAGPRLHASLTAGQAILRSYQKQAVFLKHSQRRLRWYLVTNPLWLSPRLVLVGFRLFWPSKEEERGIPSLGTELLARNLVLSTALQGTGVRVDRWVEGLAKLTQSNPEIAEASTLIANAGHLASFCDPESLDVAEVWRELTSETIDPHLGTMMDQMLPMLEHGFSVQMVAKKMGWGEGVPSQPYPVALIAIYSWLRHSYRFRKAVEPAILLGGDTASVGAIVGGLAGIHLSHHKVPPDWLKRMACWPHDRDWMKHLSERLTDWPHGVEDLHHAPALPSLALFQALRNLLLSILWMLHAVWRTPFRIWDWLF